MSPTRVKSGPRLSRKNVNKMLLAGVIILPARQAVRLAFQGECGLTDPICERTSFREKGGMPSGPNACNSDTATATKAFAAALQF